MYIMTSAISTSFARILYASDVTLNYFTMVVDKMVKNCGQIAHYREKKLRLNVVKLQFFFSSTV